MSGPAEFPPDTAWIHAEIQGEGRDWTWRAGYCTADRDGGSETYDDEREGKERTRRDAMLNATMASVLLAKDHPDTSHFELVHGSRRKQVWL